ncbi:MAG: hypothetical protein EZS28_030907, partial [Streblomastix strix]
MFESSASIQQLHIAVFQALVEGDEYAQDELVTNGYPRILVNIINTAGGNEYQQDEWIDQGLNNIYNFIIKILKGRQTDIFNPRPSLQPYPVLFKSCLEQIEDEGGNEEIEAQLVNKAIGEYDGIHNNSNLAKRRILNIYVDNSNPRPRVINFQLFLKEKGYIMLLFKKELNLFTFEKVGQIGKVPKGLLRAQSPSSSKVNQSPENSELINTTVLPRVIAKQDNTNAAEKSSRSIISKIWGNVSQQLQNTFSFSQQISTQISSELAEIYQLLEGIDILQEDQLKDSLQKLLSMIVKCSADRLFLKKRNDVSKTDQHISDSEQSRYFKICEAGLFALKQAVTSIDRFRAVITPRGGFIKRST